MREGVFDEFGRRKYLNSRENARFLQAVRKLPADREKALCLTLFYTGCRISEALSLTEAHIDWDARVVRIRTLKKRGKIEYRRIAIPDLLIRVLRKITNGKPGEILFPCHRTTGWRLIKKVMAKAEISGIQASPKGLRHAFGVRAMMDGIAITKLQKWMGHADIETTEIYLDVDDETDRELMKRTWKIR